MWQTRNAHHAVLVPDSHATQLHSSSPQQQHAGPHCILSDIQQLLSCSPHMYQSSHAKYLI